MDPRRLMTIPATWTKLRPSATVRDDDGNPTTVETSSTIHCWIAPTSSSEDTDRQQRQTGMFTAYLRPEHVVAGTDRIVFASATYEAMGPSEPWTHPRTRNVIYRTCPLRKVA